VGTGSRADNPFVFKAVEGMPEMKRLTTIAVLILVILVTDVWSQLPYSQEQIAETKILPTRQLLVGFKGHHDSIYWEVYPVIYYIENEPHVCDDPNDPRRQFQFDTAWVIPKEPGKVKGVCLVCQGGTDENE